MKTLARLVLCTAAVGLIAASPARLAHAACSSGGTVSNVNDCAPVGKGSKDCLVEFSISPVPPDDSNGFPTAKIDCLDNDPSCDNDITPGQCTFKVGVCVNVTESRFTCSANGAATYELKTPSAKDTLKPSKNVFVRENRRLLDGEIASVVPGGANQCSDEVSFVVPLKKGVSKGKSKINVQVVGALNAKDSDTVKFTCLPNPAIATQPIASARHITNANELIGGPLAYGRVGDWLIENDRVRYIVRDVGRDFSFMLTYGGHIMDADFQRKVGPIPWSGPYPAGNDSFRETTPLINISSTDNPTSISVVSSGAGGGPAVLQTSGPDDLFDPIDPWVAIKGFSTALSIPVSARDNNIPTTIMNEYTLNPGDNFVKHETIVQNTGGSTLNLYIGDYTAGGAQLEFVGPGLGFGDAAIRIGGNQSQGEVTFNFLGWLGYGQSQGISYGLIPQLYDLTSSFAQSGVTVPIYGQNLVGILLAPSNNKPPGILQVSAGGMNSFSRWLTVSDNGMGQVVDARNTLVARGDITDAASLKPGFIQGTVSVAGVPVDGARVTITKKPGARTAQYALIDVFVTKNGGFYLGTLPKGEYTAMVKVPGNPYEGGGSTPLEKPIKIGGGTTVVDFDVPATGYVQVNVTDGSNPLPAKISVVGLEAAPDPTIAENAVLATVVGNIFGYDAREKVVIYGLPQVQFADPSGTTGVFAVPPGSYQFVVSHGPEYNVFKTSVMAVSAGSPGSPQVVNATLTRVVDTTGFVSSDHHVHLINSPDSQVSKRERIVTMLAEGVDYFVASDHDFITDLSADVAAIPGAGALVKAGISDEITYFDTGHFGAYPLSGPIAGSVTGGAIDWGRAGEPAGLGYPSDNSYDLSPEEMALVAKAPPYNAIVVQANHYNSGTLGYFRVHGIDTTVATPQSSTSPTEVRQDPAITNLYSDELTALEIWIENTRPQNSLALGENLGDFFNILNNFDSTHPLNRKALVADSDTHSTTIVQAGGPRTMIASSTDNPAAINETELGNNINAGRSILTNGPFVKVSVVGDGGTTARHALGNPIIANASVAGNATINVDVNSPTWAPFDIVEIYVNTVPSCTTTSPNFVGGTKKVCTSTPTFSLPVTPTQVAGVAGDFQLQASVSQPVTVAADSWVVVVARGRDGISVPTFPMNPNSTFKRSCTGNACQTCTTNAQCSPFFGTCQDVNANTTQLAAVTTGDCGVTALALTNPLYIDRNGDGQYKGVTLP